MQVPIAFLVTVVLQGATATERIEPAMLYPIPDKGKLGYIDKTGKVVVTPTYDEAYPFVEGLGLVSKGGKYGFIDATGRVAVPIEYDDAFEFSEGLAAVHRGESYGYVDRTGKLVIPIQFRRSAEDEYTRPFQSGLAAFADSTGKFGFLDKSGSIAISPRFDYATDFYDGLAGVVSGGKTSVITITGGMLYDTPALIEEGFFEGMAVIYKGDKAGAIDKTGVQVIPFEYDLLGDFHEGYAWAVKDGMVGYIDKVGKVAIPFQWSYDPDMGSTAAGSFHSGIAWIRTRVGDDWKEGYIDKTGKFVIPARFDSAMDFEGALAEVIVGETTSYIDRTGKVVWAGKP